MVQHTGLHYQTEVLTQNLGRKTNATPTYVSLLSDLCPSSQFFSPLLTLSRPFSTDPRLDPVLLNCKIHLFNLS